MPVPLRVGAIGLNTRVERQVLPALASSPRATLAAVCSRDPAKAERFAAAYPGCRPFASLRDFVTYDGLDAVFVMTPPDVHAEMTLAALEAGRHVMCEKPLAASLPEARAMAAEARRRGLRTAVNFTYRSANALRLVERALGAPGIGRPLHFDLAYLQGRGLLRKVRPGDALDEVGSHLVDALLWWGGRPRSVQALASCGAPAGQWSLLLDLEDGATATLHASRLALGYANAIHARLQGEGGALWLRFDTESFEVRYAPAAEPPAWRTLEPDPDLRLTFAQFPAFHFDRLVGALRGEEAFPDFDHGCRVQAVLDAAVEAARTGRRTTIPSD